MTRGTIKLYAVPVAMLAIAVLACAIALDLCIWRAG